MKVIAAVAFESPEIDAGEHDYATDHGDTDLLAPKSGRRVVVHNRDTDTGDQHPEASDKGID